MTVGEVIAALQVHPLDARVVVPGYENGYDDVILVKAIAIVPTENAEWYDGRYSEADPSCAGQAEQAILVYGRNREP
jgi:hypothetical protein